jgi:hypothetical protein
MHDLMVMRAFIQARHEAFAAFVGVKMRRSVMRDEIVRIALLEHAKGRSPRLSHFQSELAKFGSKFAVRDEILRLSHRGVLVLGKETENGRGVVVRPSQGLADWYETQLPRVKTEWMRLTHALIRQDDQG